MLIDVQVYIDRLKQLSKDMADTRYDNKHSSSLCVSEAKQKIISCPWLWRFKKYLYMVSICPNDVSGYFNPNIKKVVVPVTRGIIESFTKEYNAVKDRLTDSELGMFYMTMKIIN